MKPSTACLEFVKSFEGFREHAYYDTGHVLTIGYGTTEHVQLGDTVTEKEACELLANDLQEAADAVNDLVDVELSQSQFDALCSFVYNVGRSAFAGSTLLKLVNQSQFDAAAPQFDRWNHDNGVVIAGLTRRRAAERAMFEGVA